WHLDSRSLWDPPGHDPDQGRHHEHGLGRCRLVNTVLYHPPHPGSGAAADSRRARATRSVVGVPRFGATVWAQGAQRPSLSARHAATLFQRVPSASYSTLTPEEIADNILVASSRV